MKIWTDEDKMEQVLYFFTSGKNSVHPGTKGQSWFVINKGRGLKVFYFLKENNLC